MSYGPTWSQRSYFEKALASAEEKIALYVQQVVDLRAENERLRARTEDHESARQAYKERSDYLKDENDRLRERLAKEPWCEHCGVTVRECPTCHAALGDQE